MSCFNPYLHEYITTDLKHIINNADQGVELKNLETDDQGRLKLADASSIGDIKPSKKRKLRHADMQSLKDIHFKLPLKSLVSVEVLVVDVVVHENPRCKVYKFHVKDKTSSIEVSSFMPIEQITKGKSYAFYDVTIDSFNNVRNLQYNVLSTATSISAMKSLSPALTSRKLTFLTVKDNINHSSLCCNASVTEGQQDSITFYVCSKCSAISVEQATTTNYICNLKDMSTKEIVPNIILSEELFRSVSPSMQQLYLLTTSFNVLMSENIITSLEVAN